MEKYNPIEKEWIKSLESSDSSRILQTIYEIRISGSIKILPVLFSIINNNTDPQIRNEIIKLLSEIKTPEATNFRSFTVH
jgi:hypothetical protein